MIHEITRKEHLNKRAEMWLRRGLNVRAVLRLDGYYDIYASRKVTK